MTIHTVVQGENIDVIAFKYGFHPAILWEHDENQKLRDKRKDPNVLMAGDEVCIPDRELREEIVHTGKRHTFYRNRACSVSRIQFRELDVLQAEVPFHVIPSPVSLQPDKVISDQGVLSRLSPEVSFMIADLKYTEDGRVILLEFGDGRSAGFKVLDHTITPGIAWSNFWQLLRSEQNLKHLQVWYLGRLESKPIVGWETFKRLGGLDSPNLNALEANQAFQNKAAEAHGELKTLRDYKGIIVLKRYKPKKEVLTRFSERYPRFLILNEGTTAHARNKRLTDSVFNTPELLAFRPSSLVLPKRYSPTLAPRILDALQSDHIIIKPVNFSRGIGIVGVKRDALDKTLRIILEKHNKRLPIAYAYWKHDRNQHFLVEEFIESKHIIYRHQPYDATIRIAFAIHHDGLGNIYLNYLSAYWKRPVKPVNSKGTFSQQHISKHAPDYWESLGGEVDPHDMEDMYAQLRRVLPAVYTNILVDHARRS